MSLGGVGQPVHQLVWCGLADPLLNLPSVRKKPFMGHGGLNKNEDQSSIHHGDRYHHMIGISAEII